MVNIVFETLWTFKNMMVNVVFETSKLYVKTFKLAEILKLMQFHVAML